MRINIIKHQQNAIPEIKDYQNIFRTTALGDSYCFDGWRLKDFLYELLTVAGIENEVIIDLESVILTLDQTLPSIGLNYTKDNGLWYVISNVLLRLEKYYSLNCEYHFIKNELVVSVY